MISGMRTVLLLSLVLGAFVFVCAVLPLRCSRWLKVLLAGLILLAALCFKVLELLGGGRIFAPDLPAWFVLGLSWLFLVLGVFAVLLVVFGVLRLVLWLLVPRWRRLEALVRCRWVCRVHAGGLLLAAVICSVGMYEALRLPEVRVVPLQLPVRAPLRVALLSDLHVDAVKGEDFVRALVERTNALGADVVLVAGDLVDGELAKRGEALRPLAGLRARLGVFVVLGNHDYFSGAEEWTPFLRSLGLQVLCNEWVLPEGAPAVLAGVADPSARLFGLEGPDVAKALRGAPPELPVLLLAHQPQVGLRARECGVALQVSGHTHGGQLPGLAEVTARFNCGWVSGLYETQGMLLYVSNGSSLWTGMPLRLGVPSEITLFEISPLSR